ncbi:MAG: aminoacetone oxidase family FAD-binding enzyme [Bacteroides sp.]|nr:aminoacetone oxidase family FAD-binding enzyme [Eubacterium sp.]MCM1419686.1 aminoacetone oxidase family FAD-binding enzyme [Roseburia sp.]MCM1463675.1 aminoacetone oxidase family FAD-binding enzyme [Bacteroides sp.]
MSGFDIAVVGGGASGLTAAIEAKRESPGLKVAVIERLSRVGKKLLATGNGRCNFTNRRLGAEHYQKAADLLPADPVFTRIIDNFNAEAYFRSLGVFGAADGEGRVYPLSGSAASVLDGLRLEAGRLGIETFCDLPVERIVPGEAFSLYSREKLITAKAVILAGGGCSQSALGSDGSVLRLARSLGLRVSELSPALVPLKTDAALVKGLKGVRVGASASLCRGKTPIKTERGEVQFGDNTLSGICIFDLSLSFVKGVKSVIVLDLLPDRERAEIFAILKSLRKTRANAPSEDLLTGLFHKRIGLKLLRDCTERGSTEPASSLSDRELDQIAAEIKYMEFPILGTAGFEKSQVTKGGVIAEEINDSLETKKIPGLYLCGEMLDLAGECGGYNLTFAFASGAHTGRRCAERLSRDILRDPAKRGSGNEKPPLTPPSPKRKKQERRKNQ